MTKTKLNPKEKIVYMLRTLLLIRKFYVYNSILNPINYFNVKKSIVDNIFLMALKSWSDMVEEEEMEEGVMPARAPPS